MKNEIKWNKMQKWKRPLIPIRNCGGYGKKNVPWGVRLFRKPPLQALCFCELHLPPSGFHHPSWPTLFLGLVCQPSQPPALRNPPPFEASVLSGSSNTPTLTPSCPPALLPFGPLFLQPSGAPAPQSLGPAALQPSSRPVLWCSGSPTLRPTGPPILWPSGPPALGFSFSPALLVSQAPAVVLCSSQLNMFNRFERWVRERGL